MAEDRTRIDFNAPTSLVKRADAIADLLDTSRTRILIDALRDELDELAHDEGVRHRVREAFYADKVEFETVEAVLGTEAALRMKLLRDSVDRAPPEPELTDAPSADEFYDGDVPAWTSDEEAADDGESSA